MDKMTNHKIVAIASKGGHWMQLQRISSQLQQYYNIVYISTVDYSATLPADANFNVINDFSRWNLWKVLPTFWQIWKIIRRERPKAIITTGAAPGLVAILIGRLYRMRTIWIDSIANAAELSGSGKIARKIAHHVFTQWSHLADQRVEYHGNALGLKEK
jgi:UDP-N-acetylglucosamine:LPS N-acetylglucosamine transferase